MAWFMVVPLIMVRAVVSASNKFILAGFSRLALNRYAVSIMACYASTVFNQARRNNMSAFHDLEMTSITGEPVAFNQYKGQLCLVVNVASE
jgi:hypothetical protein